jgi:hypothetical protein
MYLRGKYMDRHAQRTVQHALVHGTPSTISITCVRHSWCEFAETGKLAASLSSRYRVYSGCEPDCTRNINAYTLMAILPSGLRHLMRVCNHTGYVPWV